MGAKGARDVQQGSPSLLRRTAGEPWGAWILGRCFGVVSLDCVEGYACGLTGSDRSCSAQCDRGRRL